MNTDVATRQEQVYHEGNPPVIPLTVPSHRCAGRDPGVLSYGDKAPIGPGKTTMTSVSQDVDEAP